MTLDIAALRADTPACEAVIHFNNAGSSLQPRPVTEAVQAHLAREQEIGGYEAEDEAAPALARFYTGLAEMLSCRPHEIAYVENATRAWDMAFYALPLHEGDRILTHAAEYVSNYLAFLQLARRRGVEIDIAPSDSFGQIDLDALPGLLRPKTKLIALTHVPTQGGLVNPAEEVGQFARAHGLTYLLDACQSAGQMDLNLGRIGCDILSGTGRKYLRGPRGTGFLYVSDAIIESLDPPFIDLRAAHWIDAEHFEYAPGTKRFENWESYVAGRVGLAKAVDYALDLGLPAIEARVVALAAQLRSALAGIPGVTVLDQGARKSGIVTFLKAGEDAEATKARLSAAGINISVSGASSARIDFGPRGIAAAARASVHYFNTEDEIDRVCAVVAA